MSHVDPTGLRIKLVTRGQRNLRLNIRHAISGPDLGLGKLRRMLQDLVSLSSGFGLRGRKFVVDHGRADSCHWNLDPETFIGKRLSCLDLSVNPKP